ncbi:MAG: glycerate kinase, partial [Candidatus Eremiobacteraeota bacterium]|nr:glycerate kinase [Candidatus Eremiobacteraeota bacterium]
MSDRGAGRVVVAPDKFKGSLSASEAALAIERGLRAVWPSREIVRAPMADGGEGTVAAFLDAGWTRVVRRVRGPLGRAVDAAFALAPGGETAAIEMAAASGLATLAGAPNDVLRASSFGTGELVRAALEQGARRIVVGLGGSATNDGGAGLLEALGMRFFDADDRALAPG